MAPPSPKPARRTGLWVAVGVVVIALIILAGVVGSLPSSSPSRPDSRAPTPPPSPGPTQVKVSAVTWEFSGPNCWNTTQSSGTTVTGGGDFNVSVPLSYTGNKSQATSCTVDSANISTTGFTLLHANTPLTVSTGNSQILQLELQAPDQNLSEPVTVSSAVSATFPPETPTVNVTSVQWTFAGADCWGTATTNGTTIAGGATFNVTVALGFTGGKGQPESCTVENESVTSSGFSLVSANTPLTIDANNSQLLSLEIRAPDHNVSVGLVTNGTVNETTAPPPPPAKTVTITAVNWEFSGPSNCWSAMTTDGLNVSGGAQFSVKIKLSYTAGLLDPDSCTVQSVAVATSGFTLVSSNAPLVVDSGDTLTLAVTLDAPNENESTVLTIDATVTSP
jgi:hypothetical protein